MHEEIWPIEELQEWIKETLDKYGYAQVTWRVLDTYFTDSLEERISEKHSITYQEAYLLSGKPEKATTKRDKFKEWLEKEEIEETEEYNRTMRYRRKKDATG